MRAEHLNRWLATARKSEKENTEKEVATTTERAGMTENGETSVAQSEMGGVQLDDGHGPRPVGVPGGEAGR